MPSTFTVLNTGDNLGVDPAPFAGTGTLRQAIIDANATPNVGGPDLIAFAIPGAGVHTIHLVADLPVVNDPVTIDGYSQEGASRNTLAVGDDAVLLIDLDGGFSPPYPRGTLGISADDSTLQGLAIQGEVGVGGTGDVVQGCFFGTDVSGMIASHAAVYDLSVGGSSNTIGGTTPDARNIISGATTPYAGDAAGIVLGGTGNKVEGNYIGTDRTGTQALGNTNGIDLVGTQCVIGGLTSGAGNVISGNSNVGIYSLGDGGARDVIEGNLIGTDATGAQALPNSTGIFIGGGTDLQIGGTISEARNIISGNFIGIDSRYGSGTAIWGNYIGTDITGMHAVANTGWGVGVSGNKTVGGSSPGEGNLISGNGTGIRGIGDNNVIEGNRIGTDWTGTTNTDPGADGIYGTADDGSLADGIDFQDGGNNNLIGGLDTNAPGDRLAGAGNVISGLYLGRITGSRVEGNYIGTDITGEVALDRGGIYLGPTATGNTIGGTTSDERNVISSNDGYDFISVDGRGAPYAANNVIQGNYIGTDATGTRAIGYASNGGIEIGSAVGTKIIGNVISGSNGPGIRLARYYADTPIPSGIVIEGNWIGTDKSGTLRLNTGEGITVGSAVDTTIGGVTPGAGNTIAYSRYAGVAVGSGSVTILGNSIHDNGLLGIELDGGANNNQAAPVLTSAISSGTGTAIAGTLANYPSTSFRIEFFSNPTAAAGQGQTFLGFAPVTTDAQGNFTANLPTSLRPGTFLSATATDAAGNTSQFAADITVKAALTVVTNSSLMLVGNNPPPLTGSVNGTRFTSPFDYHTPFGDTITVTLSTTATAGSPVGQYPITATLSGANVSNYTIDPHYGTMYVVSLGADPSSTTGAQTVSFWDNKGNAKLITAADLSSLDALNLVNQGGAAFDPKSVQQLQAWLSVSPNATTAYQLAVQLAAMDLNVLTGYVQATDLVYAGALLSYASTYGITGLTSGGFIDVQNLMNAANAVLSQVSPGAPSSDPNQEYEAALTQVLQAANSNTDFVSQEVCWNLTALDLAFIFGL